MLNSKNSQANVITTILLILVSVVAVSILGIFIINFVKDNLKFSNVNVELSIDTGNGKPCYNPESLELKLYIRRTGGNGNLSAIKLVVFYNDGNRESMLNREVPLVFENFEYVFYELENKPDYIAIAPVVKIDNKEKALDLSDKVEVISSSDCSSSGQTVSGAVLSSSPESVVGKPPAPPV
jgi:hypothetical protein